MQPKLSASRCTIRFAQPQDTALILQFIQQLAQYEKMADEVVATESLLQETLFEKKQAEVLIAEYNGKPAGFALFFHNFSTFLGKAGLYLEDLFVREELRGNGIGHALFQKLAAIALERGCERLDWWCLDWNTPSMDFYKKIGAIPMEDWTVYRLTGAPLQKMAQPK